jgi:hypothetical protein
VVFRIEIRFVKGVIDAPLTVDGEIWLVPIDRFGRRRRRRRGRRL